PVIFLILGSLILQGSRAGLYDGPFGFALLAVSGTLVSLSATGIVARILSKVDDKRLEFMLRLQTQLQEARLLAAIVEHNDDSIISSSPQGRILSWNPAAQRVFGYSAEEMIGRPLGLLVPPHRLLEEQTFIQQLNTATRAIQFES